MLTVFGSLNCDLSFALKTLPASGETCLCDGYVAAPGGKGANQAVAAARAGAQVAMVGCVGADPFADVALRGLRANDVDIHAVRRVSQPTACASIWVDGRGENAIVVASGANLALRADDLHANLLHRTTTLVTQMEVDVGATADVLRRAHNQGVRTVASLAPVLPVPHDFWKHVTWLLVNRGEARALLQEHVDDAALPQALHEKLGVWCVVTLGSDGALAWGPDGSVRAPALPVDVVDTTGAGDTFAGVFAHGLDAHLPLERALRAASHAAAQVCAYVGAQPT